jgi:hypothetical protein
LEITGIKNELTIEIYFNLHETGHRLSETISWVLFWCQIKTAGREMDVV